MKFRDFSTATKVCYYVVFIGFTVGLAGVVLWLFLCSFKTTSEIFANPLGLPAHWSLRNYVDAWRNGNFSHQYLNSIVITGVSVIGILIFEGLAGYAFARFDFPGRRVIFWVFLIGQAVPSQIVVLPSFLEMAQLNLADSQLGLILQYLSWAPFAALFFRASFLAVPREIEEAAQIDGASRTRILLRVVLPMAKGSFAAVAVIYALWFWSDFLFPVAYLRTPSTYTVPMGLASFVGAYSTFWGQLFAGVIIASLPPVAFFLALRKPLEAGFAKGALNM